MTTVHISATEIVSKCVSNVMFVKILGTFGRKLVGICATVSWKLHAFQVCSITGHQL